jgi:hypothetical protein
MPARVRTGDETDDEEVAKSATAPLSDGQFRLNNLDVISSADALPRYSGRKVQVKGVLNGEGDAARIFVLSLADTGMACTD